MTDATSATRLYQLPLQPAVYGFQQQINSFTKGNSLKCFSKTISRRCPLCNLPVIWLALFNSGSTFVFVFCLRIITRCVAMPSLMAACWVGENSGPIFRRLWTKIHRIRFACVGVSVVFNAFLRLTISCCVPEIFTIKSQSCAKSHRNLIFFGGRQISGEGPPKFLVTIAQVTSDIRWRKKNKDALLAKWKIWCLLRCFQSEVVYSSTAAITSNCTWQETSKCTASIKIICSSTSRLLKNW